MGDRPEIEEYAAWIGRLQKKIDRLIEQNEHLRQELAKLAKVKEQHDAWVDLTKKIKADRAYLEELLHEWLETPFFETEDAWRKWVNEFRPRVEKALNIQVKVKPKVKCCESVSPVDPVDENTEGLEDWIIESYDSLTKLKSIADRMLESLPPKEREILEKRFKKLEEKERNHEKDR